MEAGELPALDDALTGWRISREAFASRQLERYEQIADCAREAQFDLVIEVEDPEVLLHDAWLRPSQEGIDYLRHVERRAESAARWWRKRLRVRPFVARLAGCGARLVRASCECGADHGAQPTRCNARTLCGSCSARIQKRTQRKLLGSLERWTLKEAREWRARGCKEGDRGVISLLTLSVRSSTLDDLAERRKLLSDAWHRFRAWYVKTWNRPLRYAWAVEVTEGKKHQGHVHMHVVGYFPFIDYNDLRAEWERATEGRAQSIDMRPTTKAGRSAHGAARYISKYVTKALKTLTVDTAARWTIAQHAKRAISTHRGFWIPPPDIVCNTCGVVNPHRTMDLEDFPGARRELPEIAADWTRTTDPPDG